ncbi:oxidative stress defense protein [Vibrio panuliri]|uniref:Oxidative stress defense protein n=1 Tax=Vibrio panuliri TaxID=1381081 RepID=A0A1Q9HLE9_9VIBR|nr:oxidative stress defense protein [Vibrio panuliri]KAB1459671.1 oxidative stress defense protein [Vibrio panuliri]OLQ91298.1 oxidative stress defense protein [Vibrio panuliri]OLQ96554.1 oxidative stress defense protein [Vibrio panuliri]
MNKLSLAVLALSSTLSFASLANEPSFPHLSTSGYGEVVAKPDMAEFSVQVVETTMTAEQAKQSVDKAVAAFLEQLKQKGVVAEDITSTNLYLSPQYHYPKKGQPELVGYRASRSITVTVEQLENLNSYLDIALSSGINQVDNITLKVRDEAKYQQQARMAAINDAKEKAQSLAKGFDQELGHVWQVTYNSPSARPVLMRAMSMDMKSESNGYQDSTIVIRDRVDVVYRLED